METKSFSGWINSFKNTNNENKLLFTQLKELDNVKNEFNNQIYLLKKYMELIRKNHDHLSIIKELENKGFDNYTSLGIHKILFHAPDKALCWDYIEKALHDKGNQIIDKIN